MTKGEIIAAIYDFHGTPAELREIYEVLASRVRATAVNMTDKVREAMAAGGPVRVRMRWGHGFKTGTVIRVMRKNAVVKVDGMPQFRNEYRVSPELITEIIEDES